MEIQGGTHTIVARDIVAVPTSDGSHSGQPPEAEGIQDRLRKLEIRMEFLENMNSARGRKVDERA